MPEHTRFPRQHENVLFVGIGGGNDIFSTLLAMSALRYLGWSWKRCAIAGALSPFHDHDVIATGARCLRVIKTTSKRYIPTRVGAAERRIEFVDATVSRLARDLLVTCDGVFGLDLRRGSLGLVRTFRHLAARYDQIVLVDLGGDCLYRGASDTHVLSPMFDAMVLRAFIDAKVPGLLFEAGPGTDGEIDPEPLRQALFEVGAEPHDVHPHAIAKFERLYREHIAQVRPGHTVRNTIRAFHSTDKNLTVMHGTKAIIGNFRREHSIMQRINTDLCKQFFLIEPRKLRNPFMLRCDGPKDWFCKTQIKQTRTTTEADLQYLRVSDEIWRFATPSPLFAPDWRRIMLERLLDELWLGQTCDAMWFLPADWAQLSPEHTQDFDAIDDQGLLAVRRKQT